MVEEKKREDMARASKACIYICRFMGCIFRMRVDLYHEYSTLYTLQAAKERDIISNVINNVFSFEGEASE